MKNINFTLNALKFIVVNGFQKRDHDIMTNFVNVCNNHKIDGAIYDITAEGEFGLQGFVNECGVDIYELNELCCELDASQGYHRYYVYNGDGFATSLTDVLPRYILKLSVNQSAMDDFFISLGLYDIMDASNGHNRRLVKKINRLWITGNKSAWQNILHAIYVRQVCMLGLSSKFIQSKEDAYDNAEYILKEICDNEDLQTIIDVVSKYS